MLDPFLLAELDEVHQSVGRIEFIDRVHLDKARLQAVVCRNGITREPAAKKDRQQVMGAQAAVRVVHDDIVDVGEPKDLGFNPGFLAQFAQCCVVRRFSSLNVSAGQAPQKAARVFATQTNQQFSVVSKDCGARGYFRPVA